MSFIWKPAIYNPALGVLYELPRPVTSLVILDRWDFERTKVPLQDGQIITGHSQGGVVVRVEGRLGTQAGGFKATEEDMFTELEEFRQRLDVQSDGEKYEFFLYHDSTTGMYRKFKECSTTQFQFDLSNEHLFRYSVVIEADDPVVYDTAPGV